MTKDDRRRWDERYAIQGPAQAAAIKLPDIFAGYAQVFPRTGQALDLACGQGGSAVWLACRGLTVMGLDVSPVAIGHARELARCKDIGDRCRFEVFDLDDGLPAGPAVEVIFCHKFRDRRLDHALVERLKPGGLLAIAALSAVDDAPGLFRVAAGELPDAFRGLEVIATDEGRGQAWLLARA